MALWTRLVSVSAGSLYLTQSIAHRTCPVLAVKGKEARVRGLQSYAAGRTDALQTKNLFSPLGVYDQQAAMAFFQGAAHHIVKVWCGKPSHQKVNGVLMVAAQGHVLFERCQSAINSGFLITPAQRLGQDVLMETFSPSHLRGQDKGAPFPVAMPNLIHDLILRLDGQLAVTADAVLRAKLAVKKSEEMIDLGQRGHSGPATGMADALFDGHGGGEAGHNVHVRPFKDLDILSHVWGKAFQITPLTLCKENVKGQGRFA
jgi:hypothetical protein